MFNKQIVVNTPIKPLESYSVVYLNMADVNNRKLEEFTKFDKENPIREWEIWMEGFQATGQSAEASRLSVEKARTFKEAVYLYFAKSIQKHIDELQRAKEPYNDKRLPGSDYDWYKLSIWGCKLYDNEKDARKTFG